VQSINSSCSTRIAHGGRHNPLIVQSIYSTCSSTRAAYGAATAVVGLKAAEDSVLAVGCGGCGGGAAGGCVCGAYGNEGGSGSVHYIH
jgi:hypothetical protein